MDGALVPDPRRRLPGRGAWLHRDPECLRTAERRRAFPGALRVPGPLDAAPLRAYLERPGGTDSTGLRRRSNNGRGTGTDRKQVDPS